MCNDKQGIELYPATSAIEKTRASPLPSTSHIMPMLFGKTNARSNCDEQLAVMRLRVSTQHLHSLDANTLVQQGRLEKKTRVYCHLPQVSACQVLLGSLKATILDPQVLTDGQIRQLSRLAILWHPFYILHPSAHSLGTNKLLVLPNRLGKRTRVHNHLPRANACQHAFGT